MKKRTLYLHIGMPKTATTALQHFFALNREVLQNHGITYPASGNRSAHHRLGWSIDVHNGSKKWWFDKNLLDYKKEWRTVLTQLDSEKNLLSTESVWGFNKHKIDFVKEIIPQFNAKIVIYIRRQDTLVDSWYNELVKIGIFRKLPEECDKIISLEPVKQWANLFGKDNIIVRPYEKQQFHGGNIFSDFLHHVLEIEFTDEFILPKNGANPSLHRIALEYKRMVNFIALSPAEKSETLQPLQHVSDMLQQKDFINYPVFSPRQRLQIYHKYNKVYAVIAHDYLNRKNGNLFYDAPPELSERWHPYVDLTQKDARIVNEFLAVKYPEQLATIIKGILLTQFSRGKEVRTSALKLLPGIPSASISQVLSDMLSKTKRSPEKQRYHQLNQIYDSNIWKAGKVAEDIYRKLPEMIKKPTLSVVRKLYSLARHV